MDSVKDYTLLQDELKTKYNLHYDVLFQKYPQLKPSSIEMLIKLNSIKHSKVILYNYHLREVSLVCNIHNIKYKGRPERILAYSKCPLCISKRISDNTKIAMARPSVRLKVCKENNSKIHKARFILNRHYGSTKVPTVTESLVMDFLLSKGFVWNKVVSVSEFNFISNARFYIPDFINEDRKIIIELDGRHHNSVYQQEIDSRRELIFRSMGYHVYHFTNNYVVTYRKFFEQIIEDLVKGGGDLYDRLYVK